LRVAWPIAREAQQNRVPIQGVGVRHHAAASFVDAQLPVVVFPAPCLLQKVQAAHQPAHPFGKVRQLRCRCRDEVVGNLFKIDRITLWKVDLAQPRGQTDLEVFPQKLLNRSDPERKDPERKVGDVTPIAEDEMAIWACV